MKTLRARAVSRAVTVRCGVAASGVIRAPADGFGTLRQTVGPAGGPFLPASLLKHSDEQTVAALHAVYRAIEGHGLGATDFTRWGVLAAPRLFGRVATVATLDRYAVEGAWGISPHLIPHRSLHSTSGTVSQALKIQGPNFGVGGGDTGASEALVAAAALLSRGRVPGVWVVFSGWNPEPGATPIGYHTSDAHEPICHAAALALVSARPGENGPCLSVSAGSDVGQPLTLEALVEALAGSALTEPASWRLTCGGTVVLEQAGVED